jgi:hypothetical protein
VNSVTELTIDSGVRSPYQQYRLRVSHDAHDTNSS